MRYIHSSDPAALGLHTGISQSPGCCTRGTSQSVIALMKCLNDAYHVIMICHGEEVDKIRTLSRSSCFRIVSKSLAISSFLDIVYGPESGRVGSARVKVAPVLFSARR
jgi:hypothetical protein